MNRLIDLSCSIIDAMPVHPYDDAVRLYQNKFLETDEYNNCQIEMGMHSGTHIDTPMHLLDDPIFISEIALERFAGRGCLLDVRGERIIDFKREYTAKVKKGDIVLLYTGHDRKYGSADYYTDHPVISQQLAEFFIHQGTKMVGMDLPSPDNYPFPLHKLLLSHDILLIENLTNLTELLGVENFTVTSYPIKIKAEAAPTRVVARITSLNP